MLHNVFWPGVFVSNLLLGQPIVRANQPRTAIRILKVLTSWASSRSVKNIQAMNLARWRFFKKFHCEDAEFVEYLKRDTRIQQVFGKCLSITYAFYKKKCTRKLRLK